MFDAGTTITAGLVHTMWTVLARAVMLGGMYVASQFGRHLTVDQTRQLAALVEEALGTRLT